MTSEWGVTPPFPNRVVKITGGSSPTMISEWGVTPPLSFTGSKSLFPNPQQQQQQQQKEVKRRPLLDLPATGKNRKGNKLCIPSRKKAFSVPAKTQFIFEASYEKFFHAEIWLLICHDICLQ